MVTLWTRMKLWGTAALAMLMAAGAFGLYCWFRGREHADAKLAQAKQRVADAKATAKAARTRAQVDQAVTHLPDVKPQRVGDADPATAAGKLRKWVRR